VGLIVAMKISKIKPDTIDHEALAFGPVECMDCYFDGSIPTEYFLVTPDPETDNDYIELKKVVKKQLGHDAFSEMYCNLGAVIMASCCPQCSSRNIFEDF
jgi:hypothetical protein